MNSNFEQARILMVQNQLRPNKIKEKVVLDLFQTIPKENFVPEDFKNLCYSDKNINITNKRGYLKNLHLAQIIHNADIKKDDNVLHIGGLTGYLSSMIAQLCKKLVIIEEDDKILLNLKNNLRNYNLTNIEIIQSILENGYSFFSPYDLIIIDCPLYNFKKELVEQLNSNQGRLIYIEKVNDDLSKAYKLTRNNDTQNLEFLFDVFSNFAIDEIDRSFKF